MAKMYEQVISFSKFVPNHGYEYEDSGYMRGNFEEGSDEFKTVTTKCYDGSWLYDEFSEEQIEEMKNGEYDIMVKLSVRATDEIDSKPIFEDSVWAGEYFAEHLDDDADEEEGDENDD